MAFPILLVGWCHKSGIDWLTSLFGAASKPFETSGRGRRRSLSSQRYRRPSHGWISPTRAGSPDLAQQPVIVLLNQTGLGGPDRQRQLESRWKQHWSSQAVIHDVMIWMPLPDAGCRKAFYGIASFRRYRKSSNPS